MVTSKQNLRKKVNYPCKTHGKQIEGYCSSDKALLCIDCILSGDHKNHEMTNIENGAKKEKELLTAKFKQAQTIKEQIQSTQHKINSHHESLGLLAQDNIMRLQNMYQYIIQLIQERETQQIEEIEAKLSKEVAYLDGRRLNNATMLENIDEFQKSWHQLGEKQDYEILLDIDKLYS